MMPSGAETSLLSSGGSTDTLGHGLTHYAKESLEEPVAPGMMLPMSSLQIRGCPDDPYTHFRMSIHP